MVKIVRVEPTPSPNSMKLTLDAKLNPGVRLDYKQGEESNAPSHIRKLLAIPGVTGVFHTADFVALERHPKGDWQAILDAAAQALGVADKQETAVATAGSGTTEAAPEPERGFGEVTVRVQTFRSIPMQVRVSAGLEEKRAALPERFQKAAAEAGLASPNLIMERKLEERGVRYGDLQEVLDDVVKELEASFDQGRLDRLVASSHGQGGASEARMDNAPDTVPELAPATAAKELSDPDWRVRYAALERLKPGTDTLPLLVRALKDPHTSIRRLAVVCTGDIKEGVSLPYLLEALKDPSPIIRRTAGDTLSDRGDPAAVPAMEEALGDPNKLVRWRAARFLYEVGDESSLPALEKAGNDPEFEIRLQVRLALERIQGGEAAQGTVWQQMTRRNENEG